jgi:phenol 2-monooxygenase
MSTVQQCDVLVSGAGPVGLLVALGLEQQGISTCLIGKLCEIFYYHFELTPRAEKRERESQKLYGRAGGLYPRTLELLEQLDVIDDLEQMGFSARANANFNNGKRVVARGWQVIFEGLHNTFFNYMLNIRQKFSEDIFGEKYCGLGKNIHYGWQFKGLERIETSTDEYNIAANIEHSATGKEKIIKWYVTQ